MLMLLDHHGLASDCCYNGILAENTCSYIVYLYAHMQLKALNSVNELLFLSFHFANESENILGNDSNTSKIHMTLLWIQSYKADIIIGSGDSMATMIEIA